ncbi:hypothetical protein ElyMa_003191900 [Elysia marginata]|uniref:Uncharacterized protein n=1 Tax=Elysia marginata TaxID=1093978 RepID=A0AAV4J106_9GAST|nr:hypothetical protein ElyMa_003191900 [Elysia marginata]
MQPPMKLYRPLALLLIINLLCNYWLFIFAVRWQPLSRLFSEGHWDGESAGVAIGLTTLIWWLVTIIGLWLQHRWALPNFAAFASSLVTFLSVSVVPFIPSFFSAKAASFVAMTLNFGLACLALAVWWNEKTEPNK